MRGCLSFVLFAAVLVGALVWFAVPPLADVLVTQGLAIALDGRVAAHVESSFPPSLLTFRADAVTVDGTDVRPRGSGFVAGGLQLRLDGVDLLARRATSVSGALTDVTIPATASPTGSLVVPRIGLSGSGSAIDATATIPGESVRALVAAAVEREVGRAPEEVALVDPDRIGVRMGAATLEGRLEVRSGALVAVLDRPAVAVRLVGPAETAPLALERATVVGGDLVLEGTLDPAALGLSSSTP